MSGYKTLVNEDVEKDVEVQKSDKDSNSKPSRMIIPNTLGFALVAFAIILLLIFGFYKMVPEENYRFRTKVNLYKSLANDGFYEIYKRLDKKMENDYQTFLNIMEFISKNEEECKIEGNVVRYIRDAFYVSESCYNTMVNKNYISTRESFVYILYYLQI